MPRGASPQREREYNELKEKFHEEGRYEGRQKEVAARIVNKQRAQKGETKQANGQKRTSVPKTKGSSSGSKSRSTPRKKSTQ